jgi:hypothetical protein
MLYDLNNFHTYVYGFYGKGGVYDMNATAEQIEQATKILYKRYKPEEIDHDSIDRERVRDILIEKFNLVFPS